MQIRIHRGSSEIGGNCIEVKSGNQFILLDIGMPLTIDDINQVKLPEIHGLKKYDNPDFLGIVISHPHQDHYGLLSKVDSNIPVYIGKHAHALIEAANCFLPVKYEINNPNYYEHQKSFQIGPFTLTPYLMDHSAFDAYGFKVSTGDKTIFYTGDFRGHGRKNKLFDQLVDNPPENIDALLMEGTNIGQRGEKVTKSETELEDDIVDVLSKTKGIALCWFSGQNIDRFVTFYRAAKKANRTFIIDLYTAHVIQSLGLSTLPNPSDSDLRVYLPKNLKRHIIKTQQFDIVKPYYDCRIYMDEILNNPDKYLMTFRPSMTKDFDPLFEKNSSSLIYSMWEGYLKESNIPDWCQKHNINIFNIHTSGHSTISDMKRLASSLKPKNLLPIHTTKKHDFIDNFENVRVCEDMNWIDI
ncbi:MAG: MBL fold metallo-hydrolase [Gammaproteobacteria bacterium]